MNGGLKLKLDPPDKFSGKDDYENFAKRLRNYMCLWDLRYSKEMKWAESMETPITTKEVAERDVDELQKGMTANLSAKLYYVLTNLTEGPAYTIVDQIEDSNGLEAWRRLAKRYAKIKMQSAIMKLVTIVTTKFGEKNF